MFSHPQFRKFIATSAALLALAACGGDSPVAPEQEQNGPPKEAMPTGEPEFIILGGDVFIELGRNELLVPSSRVTRWRLLWWTSSRSSSAPVDWRGVVTGRTEGQSTVTARSLGGAQTWSVYTYDKSRANLNVAPSVISLDVGGRVNLVSSLATGSGIDLPVARSFRSDNPGVVTVSANGDVVSAVSRGTANIVVTTPLGINRSIPVSVGEQKSSDNGAPALVTGVELTPGGTLNIPPGLTQGFSLRVSYSDGVSRASRDFYTATGGEITPDGIYTAPSAAGTYLVIGGVEDSPIRDTVRLVVTVPQGPRVLERISISPKTASIEPGNVQQFSVSANWSNGDREVPAVTWSRVGGSASGSITSGGRYTAPSASGTYRVIVRQNGGTLADTATVTVTSAAPVLTSLRISPRTVTIPASGTHQFSAAAEWSNGSSSVPTVTWSRIGGSSSGSISSSGQYTAPSSPGTYRVVVAHSGGTLRDTAVVTVVAPTLTRLRITPDRVSLNPRGVQQFRAEAEWNNGSTTVPSLSWSRVGGGSVSTSGRYTAPNNAGTYRVIVAHTGGSLRDTAVITVGSQQPTVTSFELSPGSANLQAGATRQFSTSVAWSDGGSRPVTVSYQATGGSVSVGGLYTAGQIAGTFMVIATCSCGSADTSAVYVSAAPAQLIGLTINPKTVTLAPGATRQFGVSAQWSTGATTVPPLTWSRIGSAGSISSNGLYTAPSTPGTYRVVVAHSGGSSRDTAVVTVQGSGGGSGGDVPVAEPSDFTPNMPTGAGLQQIVDTRFGDITTGNRFNADGLSYGWDGRNAVDPTAPYGSNVFETFYAGNIRSNGDGGSILYGHEGQKWRKMYFSLTVWVSENYSIHTGCEKFFYPLITTGGRQTGSQVFAWCLLDGDHANGPTWGLKDIIGGKWYTQSSAKKLQKGKWQTIEMYVVMNTPGASNGIWRAWIDGVQVLNATDVRYSDQSSQSVFDGIRFTGTRGGSSSQFVTPPEGQVRRYSRMAFFASEY